MKFANFNIDSQITYVRYHRSSNIHEHWEKLYLIIISHSNKTINYNFFNIWTKHKNFTYDSYHSLSSNVNLIHELQ